MLKLLNKTLVLTFYQQHAGLFLVVLYLLFGAVEGSQIVSYQKALLLGVCSSPSFLAIVFGIWLLYGLKCVHFMHKKQAQENYGFLQLLNSLSKKRQQQLWAYVYALCFAPILIYAILIVLMSISSGYHFSAIATLIFVPALVFIAAIYTYHQVSHQYNLSKTFLKLPSFKLPKPYWLWSLYHFLTEQKINLIVTKVMSFLFFKAILWAFADVGHDIKVYLTAMFAVVLSHAVLLFNMVKFEAGHLSFMVSLPIRQSTHVKYQIVTLLILIIPEILLYGWLVSFDLIFVLRALIFSLGSLLFLKALVIFLKADMESYMKWLLFYFFITMLAILGSYDIVLSGISVLLALSYLILNRRDIKVLI